MTGHWMRGIVYSLIACLSYAVLFGSATWLIYAIMSWQWETGHWLVAVRAFAGIGLVVWLLYVLDLNGLRKFLKQKEICK